MFSQAMNLTNAWFCYKILCVCVYSLHHSAEALCAANPQVAGKGVWSTAAWKEVG